MAGRRICRTAEEAFDAGWNEPCDHGADPAECSVCGLTETEIARLVVLLRDLATPAAVKAAA